MHTATEIPSWADRSTAGLFEWWLEMAERGLIHHPDDAPEDIVYVTTGGRYFDDAACKKLGEIYNSMHSVHGDLIYTAGAEAMQALHTCAEQPSAF